MGVVSDVVCDNATIHCACVYVCVCCMCVCCV